MNASERFERQRQQLQALIELLEQERSALVARDGGAIEQLAAAKQQLLAAIADTDRALSQELSADAELAQAKGELDALLDHCRSLNELNGQVIQLSLNSLGRLQQLMAEARGRGSVTYDDKGKTKPSLGTGRSFEV